MNLNDRIVREEERRHITGRSAASWWRDEQAGTAPKRLQIGPNAVGWKLSDLISWVESREPALPESIGNRFNRATIVSSDVESTQM